MPERQSRAYAIVQELRLLGGFAEFTFDEATADNLRSAKTPSSVQYFGFERPDGAHFSIRHYPGWGKKAGDIICCAGKIDELGQTPAPPATSGRTPTPAAPTTTLPAPSPPHAQPWRNTGARA